MMRVSPVWARLNPFVIVLQGLVSLPQSSLSFPVGSTKRPGEILIVAGLERIVGSARLVALIVTEFGLGGASGAK
jgi:hypothetical protein